jgi:hypothetical protein
MSRTLTAAVGLALVVCAAASSPAGDGKLLLEKKDKLTDKDAGYKTSDKRLEPLNGNPCKIYTIKLAKGDTVVIRLKSKDFDAFVVVEDAKGKVLDMNDDDPDDKSNGRDSKLVWTAPADGEYRAVATCYVHLGSKTKYGDFQLTIEKAK